jgi:hypothetical protein
VRVCEWGWTVGHSSIVAAATDSEDRASLA